MDYGPEAFAALWDEVEHQSGALLPDACLPQDADYTDPPYIKNTGVQKGITCGCGNDSRFVSLYEVEPGTKKEMASARKRGSGYVTACAVCDSMGAWPRYEEAVYAADPDLDPRNRVEEEDDE